jgi:lysophospholipase L1-like esterase
MPEFSMDVAINSRGYRGEELVRTPSKRLRILAVGDSFTFGYGVAEADSYPARLARDLRQRVGVDTIDVVNAGFAACYYPDTYYLYLKKRGLALDPDLILVGFFIGNDVDHDWSDENAWVETDGDGLPLRIINVNAGVENGYLVKRNKRWRYRYPVLRNSHLVQAIAAALERWTGDTTAQPTAGPYYNRWMYRKEYLPRTDAVVEKVERLFRAMRALAAGRHVPLVVAMIPAREQVYPGGYPLGDVDLDKPQRLFGEFFAREGIDVLDLLPVFRRAAAKESLYYEQDLHLNRRGYEVMAETIASYLIGYGPFSEEVARMTQPVAESSQGAGR